jgi:hypothetical protein
MLLLALMHAGNHWEISANEKHTQTKPISSYSINLKQAQRRNNPTERRISSHETQKHSPQRSMYLISLV